MCYYESICSLVNTGEAEEDEQLIKKSIGGND